MKQALVGGGGEEGSESEAIRIQFQVASTHGKRERGGEEEEEEEGE